MIKWLIRRRLAAFERALEYDVSYMRELLDIDLGAFLKFARVTGISSYRRDVPRDVWYAVKVVGAMAEDCGPCTQLVVTMALQDGVEPRTLAAVVERRDAAMPADVRLGVRYARAVLAHHADADAAREDIVGLWGQRALVSLAFGLTSARLYPTLKYALGHGQACRKIVIERETLVPVHA
jgi:hypothetical protein